MGRAAAVAALALLLLGLGLLARGLRQDSAARASFPQIQGTLEVAGLSAPVQILRTARGIPHVRAESESDAFFGLGFAHAQDRLGQMVWLSRTARGRTAEWVGESGLASDRVARTLGLAALAEEQQAHLDPASKAALEAYARGVNARIARVRAGDAAPPRALARRADEIEDWTPADSLAVMKLYAWGLSDALEASLVLADVIQQLGGFAARRFFPDGSADDGFRLPGSLPVTAESRPQRGPGSALRRALGLAGASVGSSAWVVGGTHTQSGRPLLVADSHLEPTVPALLHLAHVSGGDLDVAGAALPGVPVFWTGHNRRVAWASTHARAATTDLYRETLRASDPSRYHDGRRWQAVETRVEEIRVRGGDDVTLSVRSTRHGPLLEPILEAPREPLSLAWTGARAGGTGVASLLALAHAGSADALLAALERHVEPPLALVYADADGAAGLQVAGWIPRRAITTALLPLPGRAPHYEWKGRIPFEALPAVRLEGGQGWAVAADNRFAASDKGEHIEWLWRSGERARRIDQLLRAATRRGPVDLRRMARMQSDVRMLRGRELVSDALSLAGGPGDLPAEAREVAALLTDWSGDARADSPAAAAYHVFLQALTEQLLEPHLGSELLSRYLALPQVDPTSLVADLVRDAAGGGEPGTWSDADAMRSAVRRSLREAWFRLAYRLGPDREKWNWGRLHPLRFRPFAPAPGASALGPFAFGGSATTVAVAEYDPAVPFGVRVAATYRFAIDTSALDEALVSLAPGQSEHPGHAHYRSGLDDWLEGKPGVMVSSPLLVEESAAARLVLTPAP